MKCFLITVLSALLFSNCSSQQGQAGQAKPAFDKVIYHTSGCFGTCPAYGLEVEADKGVKLVVERVYKAGSFKPDSTRMGSYKGMLTDDQYRKLLEELKAADIGHLKFPDVMCCDGPITTLIVYQNGKRHYFKSMTPPQQARSLLNYLFALCENANFQKAEEKITIEK